MENIKYRTTFERITPESAELGDAEERGWVSEEPETADRDDMLTLLHGTEPSQWPLNTADSANVWFTAYGDQDLLDGSHVNHSHHPVSPEDGAAMIDLWFAANAGRAS